MSTHYLQEAELMCDRVAFLHGGQVAACDTVANLKRELQGEPVVEVKLEGYTETVGETLRVAPGVREVFEQVTDAAIGRATLRVALSNGAGPAEVLRMLEQQGPARIRSMRPVEPSLEEVFFHRVGRRLS
jgi:ABC-type multidrug transport system ATPase subunit